MKTTIDNAGRLVIPKDIRRESGIRPGMPLEVRWENGKIAITPAPLPVTLERKGRLLVAVPSKETPHLTADSVERPVKNCAANAPSAPLKNAVRFPAGYEPHDRGGLYVA